MDYLITVSYEGISPMCKNNCGAQRDPGGPDLCSPVCGVQCHSLTNCGGLVCGIQTL
jgi:hypothetical protein